MLRGKAILAALAITVGLVAVPGSAEAHPGGGASITVSGFDAVSKLPARVNAGQTDNSLLVVVAARRAITDGSIRIALPERTWPTPLVATGALSSVVTATGTVVVRPAPALGLADPSVPAGQACQWPQAAPAVDQWFGWQVITVSAVTCQVGQKLAIRVRDIQAPTRPGRYVLPFSVQDGNGRLVDVGVAQVGVQPVPSVRLRVVVPDNPVVGTPFPVQITALRADGLVDGAYRGSVRLATVDLADCSQEPSADAVAHVFTAVDHGSATVMVTVSSAAAHRIRADDIVHAARSGFSNPFEVTYIPGYPGVCSIHYD